MKVTYFISSRYSRERNRLSGAHMFYRPQRHGESNVSRHAPFRPGNIGAGLVRRTLVQPR